MLVFSMFVRVFLDEFFGRMLLDLGLIKISELNNACSHIPFHCIIITREVTK